MMTTTRELTKISTRSWLLVSSTTLALLISACGAEDPGAKSRRNTPAATTTATTTAPPPASTTDGPPSPPPAGTRPPPSSTAAGSVGKLNDQAVTFDWPNIDITAAGTCLAGHYLGGFDGLYASPAAFNAPIPVNGNVDMRLEQSQDGEFLEISNGTIEGLANGLFPFYGTLEGQLDCTTKQFDAIYTGGYEVIGVFYPFAGPLLAFYNPVATSLEFGQWSVGEAGAVPQPAVAKGPIPPQPVPGGNGAWGVNWVGP